MENTDLKNKRKRARNFIAKTKKQKLAFLGTVIGLSATIFSPDDSTRQHAAGVFMIPLAETEPLVLGAFPIAIPNVRFGFTLDDFKVSNHKVSSGQTFGALLSKEGLSATEIDQLVKNSAGVFNFQRNFAVGKPYYLLRSKADGRLLHMIFEPDVYQYFIFDLQGNLQVRREEHPLEVRHRSVDGKVESTLWEALTSSGVHMEAAAEMEDALQSSVDFSQVQDDDEFKLIYDEKFINGESVGIGRLYAAYYSRGGKESYAFWFDNGKYKGYYDLEGRPTKKMFLRSPLKYTRISSKFNPRRFHPILKRVRPHLGTDYAAPHGTPIYAVGDGVIAEAGYNGSSGRFVTIKHDGVYKTQYLHMSRFAKGIRKGASVHRGDVIGYVGSTGLATGPHVCFRFWKRGKAVNHLRENLPTLKKLPKEAMPEFYEVRDKYLVRLKDKDFGGASYVQQPSADTNASGTLP
jgi:murein DD-endopeptidase MepM/ murein hydrolase activator NlpD